MTTTGKTPEQYWITVNQYAAEMIAEYGSNYPDDLEQSNFLYDRIKNFIGNFSMITEEQNCLMILRESKHPNSLDEKYGAGHGVKLIIEDGISYHLKALARSAMFADIIDRFNHLHQ
ncbi:hypothetical protein NG799_01860 [Laspinema sp. D1]|uniref:Uncharacterized protein n=2 Tax=Laspinema TaxID=2584823 RepID=A0ABT2MNS3_9CYAN|nr:MULTISPECIES: hypothetical protein [unclassified Laspinema]MCT7965077.1 hypothetical protein [Laspinema sp. D2a]MCT7977636.1 hypothetical protein [Laspinema sp. D3b]MCT7992481.1 hypothetical protein [Laspinema sp. D3c]